MCVDLFAPGNAITIEYLHERVYINTSHQHLSANVTVDAFIRNDNFDSRPIQSLRFQFPHVIDWTRAGSIEVGEPTPLSVKCEVVLRNGSGYSSRRGQS